LAFYPGLPGCSHLGGQLLQPDPPSQKLASAVLAAKMVTPHASDGWKLTDHFLLKSIDDFTLTRRYQHLKGSEKRIGI
jgi:hypothetical protein